MTKIEKDWYPEPIPGFDALEWKWKIQAEIYEETKNMTLEEQRERTRQVSERFRAEGERLRAERAVASHT